MTSRANVTFPYEKDGVKVFGKLDELMLKYFRTSNGELHHEAYQVGQLLSFYFAVYGLVVQNQRPGARVPLQLENSAQVLAGLEAPFTLVYDNKFFQDNYLVIVSKLKTGFTRMEVARRLNENEAHLAQSLVLSQNEHLLTIAGLVGGTAIEREFAVELIRLNNDSIEKGKEYLVAQREMVEEAIKQRQLREKGGANV